MWQRFLRNLFYKTWRPYYLLVWSLFLSTSLYADGIVSGFLSQLESQNKKYEHYYFKVKQKKLALKKLKDLTQLELSPVEYESIQTNTPARYLNLLSKNICTDIDLMKNGLLKNRNGTLNEIIVVGSVGNEKIEFITTIYNFISFHEKRACFKNKDMALLFSPENLKSTLKTLSVPDGQKQCEAFHHKTIQEGYLPYLCGIRESLTKNTNHPFLSKPILKKEVSKYHRSFLEYFCQNPDSNKNFCANYITEGVWKKALTRDESFPDLNYRCLNLYNKSKLTTAELQKCATMIQQNPDYCVFENNNRFPHLRPGENCKNLSDNLFKMRLKRDYQDCPNRVNNSVFTNVHRIVQHFSKAKLEYDQDQCIFQVHHSVFSLLKKLKREQSWPFTICYMSKITKEEKCHPYIPGKGNQDPSSEESIIGKSLYSLIGAPRDTQCLYINQDDYRPYLLKYKNGCFITYDKNNCSIENCSKKIIFNGKEIKGISFKGVSQFDYFHNSFKNEKNSLQSLLIESLKLQKKEILNLTQLKSFYQLHKNGVVHGIACLEDLIPHIYQGLNLNQCTPTPIIVDHVIKEPFSLSVLLAIDNLHSPRTISWKRLFNAVRNYRNLHPLKLWSLNGLY